MQHYRGIYMLQEKVSRDKDRVNVTKFDAAADMSGGHSLAGPPGRFDGSNLRLSALCCQTCGSSNPHVERGAQQGTLPAAVRPSLPRAPRVPEATCFCMAAWGRLLLSPQCLHRPRACAAAGGYLLAYENDNVEAKDTVITTRLSKLTFIMEYPKQRDDATVMWIQK